MIFLIKTCPFIKQEFQIFWGKKDAKKTLKYKKNKKVKIVVNNVKNDR